VDGDDFLQENELELFNLILVCLVDIFEFFNLNMKPIDTFELFNLSPKI